MQPNFSRVAHFPTHGKFLPIWRTFSNRDTFFQVVHIFPPVAHLFKYGKFVQVLHIFPIFNIWPIFASMAHFSWCSTFIPSVSGIIKLWAIFLNLDQFHSVVHLFKCNSIILNCFPFYKVFLQMQHISLSEALFFQVQPKCWFSKSRHVKWIKIK